MDVSPRSLAGGTDEHEPVGDSWIIPSSSGHLVPRRHNPDPATAVVNPAGIQRYFKPESKSNDHINRMPEPVVSASPAQQPGRLVKQRSATEDVKSRRRRSAKLLVSKQSASVEDPREQRQQSAQTPTRSPNQKASDKGLKERRRRTAALLLSSQDRIAETAISDTSVGDSIRSEPRSPESSDGDDSFIVSDEDKLTRSCLTDHSSVRLICTDHAYRHMDLLHIIPCLTHGSEASGVLRPRFTSGRVRLVSHGLRACGT